MYSQSGKFWRASDSFFNRVATSADPYLRTKYRDWVALSRQPDRASKRYKVLSSRLSRLPASGAKAAQIRVDPAFRQNILAIAGTAGPIVTKEIDKTMASLAFFAWRKWPIDTGFSKALLSLEYTVLNRDVLQASLRSNAWYSFYIKTRQNGLGGRQPWRILIFNPAPDKVQAAAEQIATGIDRFIDGGSA